MAKEALVRFWSEYLPAHPGVRAHLGAITDEDQFVTALVDAGSKAGFDFSEREIKEILGAPGRSPAAGELSDTQLDAVSGGKAGGDPVKYMEYKLKEVFVS